jgi:ankyrin repeat protein
MMRSAYNEIDETALHIAAEKNDVEIIRVLVKAGADVHARRIFDETPLDVAVKLGAYAAEAELKLFVGLPRIEVD